MIAGHLVGVSTDRFGSELTADLTIGDTEVQVASTIFFNETEGGTLLLNGTALAYEAFDDPDSDDDSVGDDDGPTTLVLTAPSPVAADEGDRVYELDTTTGQDGDPVQELTALVTIDDRDGGDALPARVRAGLVDQLDSDFETYVGKAVELEHQGGELVLVDILGSKATGQVKFTQDQFTVTHTGPQVWTLTYVPLQDSEHVYWHPDGGAGIYQQGDEWSREGWTLSVPDADGVFQPGDLVVVEYAYRDPARMPRVCISVDVPDGEDPTFLLTTPDGPTYLAPTPALVGDGQVLADGSDDTYWNLAVYRDDNVGARQGFATLSGAATVVGSKLTYALRLASRLTGTLTTGTSVGLSLCLVTKEGPGTDNNDFGGKLFWSKDVVVDPPGEDFEVHDLTGTMDDPDFATFLPNYPDSDGARTPTLADVAALLNTGDLYLEVSPFLLGDVSGSGLLDLRLLELSFLADCPDDPTD